MMDLETLTDAELLFHLAATGDEPAVEEALALSAANICPYGIDDDVAPTGAPAQRQPPPAGMPCPFPARHPHGGLLLQWGVNGVTGEPWAVYSAVLDTRPCPFCQQELGSRRGACLAIMPPGANPGDRPSDYGFGPRSARWADQECAALYRGDKITAMATSRIARTMPPCRLCGAEYKSHGITLPSLWEAVCPEPAPDGQYYRPSEPFTSRNYPYKTIIDSPKYTADGKVAYAVDQAAPIPGTGTDG